MPSEWASSIGRDLAAHAEGRWPRGMAEMIAVELDKAAAKGRREGARDAMWCQSCGTVTGDGNCDCTFTGTGEQSLVPFADELSRVVRRKALEDALRSLPRPLTQNGSSWLQFERSSKAIRNLMQEER